MSENKEDSMKISDKKQEPKHVFVRLLDDQTTIAIPIGSLASYSVACVISHVKSNKHANYSVMIRGRPTPLSTQVSPGDTLQIRRLDSQFHLLGGSANSDHDSNYMKPPPRSPINAL